jgi:hypothetical protein
MRGTSLQARLFISYVILVGIVIGVIAIGIVLSLTPAQFYIEPSPND